jgi:hypothetical protein
MNMLCETLRSGLSSVIVVPSSALETMDLGAIAGLTAHAQQGSRRQPEEPEPPAGPAYQRFSGPASVGRWRGSPQWRILRLAHALVPGQRRWPSGHNSDAQGGRWRSVPVTGPSAKRRVPRDSA